jgi:hypothetical protein
MNPQFIAPLKPRARPAHASACAAAGRNAGGTEGHY